MNDARPRLVVVESLASLAGGQRVLLDLMPALAADFHVTVVVPETGPLTQALSPFPVSILVWPMGARYTIQRKDWRDVLTFATATPRLTLALARLIRQIGAQLVLLNSTPAFPWGTVGSWLAGCPAVWFTHNVLADAKTLWLLRLLARFPNVRALLATSAEAGLQYQARARVAVVRPGVDVNVFQPDPEARRQKRAEINLAQEATVFAIVGDLIRLKGQHLAIRAAHQVVARHPDFHLLIIGDARPEAESQAYKAELLPAAQTSPNLHVLGYRDDLPALLPAVDGLIVASDTETGPLVLVQALACGVPAISTPVGHAPALLEDGACGWLFPVGDEAALAQAMERLLATPERAQMGRRGRERICAGWSLAQSQAKVVAELRAILGPESHSR